jgi:hypothetical protein
MGSVSSIAPRGFNRKTISLRQPDGRDTAKDADFAALDDHELPDLPRTNPLPVLKLWLVGRCKRKVHSHEFGCYLNDSTDPPS